MIKSKIVLSLVGCMLILGGCGDRADISNGDTVVIPDPNDRDGDGVLNVNDVDENNVSVADDPCKPNNYPGYDRYDYNNTIWQSADCDEDGYLNGTEDNISLGERHFISDPYDATTTPADDDDGDGVPNYLDSDSNDPCVPSVEAKTCDKDGDGLTNEEEDVNWNGVVDANETNPDNNDTDGDGVVDGSDKVDGKSVALDACLPPQDAGYRGYDNNNTMWQIDNCDGDDFANGTEDNITLDPSYISDPYDADSIPPDSDGDGWYDYEDANASDPCVPSVESKTCDKDGDGLINIDEDVNWDGIVQSDETDKNDSDTDGDGVIDGDDMVNGDSTALDACLPTQKAGYDKYDHNKTLWQEANCDGDSALNGTEDNISVDPSYISDPYNATCFTFGITKYCEVEAKDGRYWIDRNLGAKRVCEDVNDTECFGTLYQWGRGEDGHEQTNSPTQEDRPTSLPYVDERFIKVDGDWVDDDDGDSVDQREASWSQDEDNASYLKEHDVCPKGFYVPSTDEIKDMKKAEDIGNLDDAFDSNLTIGANGYRDGISADLADQNSTAYIWSYERDTSGKSTGYSFSEDGTAEEYVIRSTGYAVRCIKK